MAIVVKPIPNTAVVLTRPRKHIAQSKNTAFNFQIYYYLLITTL